MAIAVSNHFSVFLSVILYMTSFPPPGCTFKRPVAVSFNLLLLFRRASAPDPDRNWTPIYRIFPVFHRPSLPRLPFWQLSSSSGMLSGSGPPANDTWQSGYGRLAHPRKRRLSLFQKVLSRGLSPGTSACFGISDFRAKGLKQMGLMGPGQNPQTAYSAGKL